MTEHKAVKDAVWDITDNADVRTTYQATPDELEGKGITTERIESAKDDRALTTRRNGGKMWLIWNPGWNESFF